MGFEFAEVITELGQGVVCGCELEGGEHGLVDLTEAPSTQLGAAVEQNFHEAEHAGVLDLNARDFGVSRGDGQSQTLEQGKVDVDIESLGLEFSETIGNGRQGLTNGFQVIQGFFQSEVLQVVAEDLQAQEGRELLVHAEHGIFGAGAQHVMTMLNSFQGSGEFAADSPVQAKSEHVREFVGGETEQSEVTGALEEFVDGKVSAEVKVGQYSTCCSE